MRTIGRNLIGLAVLAALLASRRAAAQVGAAAPDLQAGTSPAVHRQVVALKRQAFAFVDEGKWDKAEEALAAALALRPDDPVTLYNLACVRARRGNGDAAVESLERAAAAGFSDFVLVARDPDLDALRALPRFKAFVAAKEKWQRRAAEATLAGLKARFGEGGAYRYEVDHRRKLIFAVGADEATFARVKDWLTRQAESQRRELFAHRPDAFVRVIIPTPADYRTLIPARNVGGMYHDATKTLIAQKIGLALTHEFTHALHAGDRAPLGQEHAAWVAEGLGAMYEGAAFDAQGALVPLDNQRTDTARRLAARKTFMPLEKLVTLSPAEMLERPLVTYAQAATLMSFLRERGELRKFYDAYKAGFAADPTGRAALEQATGMDLPAIQAAWVDWLLARHGAAAPAAGRGGRADGQR